MEKKVYCMIAERIKCIKYIKAPNVPDAELVRRGLVKACHSDDVLKMMMDGKSIVLQKSDPDRHNLLCDIDDDDEIEDKSDVTVILVKIPEQSVVNPEPSNYCDLQPGETVELDIPIIFEDLTEIQTNKMDDSTALDHTKIPEEPGTSIKTQVKPIHSTIQPVGESSSSCLKLSSTTGPGSIPYPAPLPELTKDLQVILMNVGVFEGVKSFIYFWASHLLHCTDDRPTKQDYSNLAMSIIDAYPVLKGGANGCGILKQQLSINVRSRRANMKKRSQKRDNKRSIKGSTGDAILIPSEAFRSAKTDAEAAQKELDKNSKVVDTAHVRRLLRETLLPRRTWIEKEAKRILDVTTKYPQLAVHDLIVYEFTTWKNLKLEEIYQKVDVLLEKLASLFCLEAVTEESKASIIDRLNNELGNKRLAKTTTALFIVKEVMGSTENLVTAQDESPRAVCYIAEQGIASAFIVADEGVRVKIPEPTVHKLVVALLASYYVWDTAYPTAYANVLQYLDHEILGMPIKNNNVVSKFIRKRDVALKTVATDNGDK